MSVSYHAPGSPIEGAEVGDVILTHSAFWTGKLIRFGQRLRFRGRRRCFAYWNHAAVVVKAGPNPQIAEALGHGVVQNPLAKYADTEYVHVGTNFHVLDQIQVRLFVEDVLDRRTRYGYMEILSLGLTLLIPLSIQFGSPGTAICSGLVAAALTRSGVIWPKTPDYMMPADLAEYFNAGEP